MAVEKRRWGFGLPDQVERPAAPVSRQPRGGRFEHLRGDLVGGFAAAVLTIPISMGYGLLAFSPLGDAMVPQAILAGLYAPVCGCLVALLLGARTTMIYSPRSIVTFLISSLLTQNLVRSNLPVLQEASPATFLTLAFLMILLAGLFQTCFGVLRMGTLVKYVPAPVLAGFQNAAAILILFSQQDAMLGLTHHVAPLDLPFHLAQVQPLTLMVGVVTAALILNAARITKRIPPTLLGLIGGVGLYYAFALAGSGTALGTRVGSIPFALPSMHHALDFVNLMREPGMLQVLPTLVAGAFSLAIVASLDGMLCARLVQQDSGNRVHPNGELVRLGVGNMVAAVFGGIANGINLGSSFANHRSGARTRLSVLVHAVCIALAILTFTALIAWLPRVVMAAMLVVIAIQLFDRWTLQMLRQLMRGGLADARNMLSDLAIIAVVTVVAVALNIVAAVGLGIAVTMLVFLRRMSKSVVRRTYRCDVVQSRKTREPKTADLLAAHGGTILVLELDGPIFFGTAEDLGSFVEGAVGPEIRFAIFDLKRVSEIDGTGARVMAQIHERLRKGKKSMLVSGLSPGSHIANVLEDMGIAATLIDGGYFPDADRAIEWAEDRLIGLFAGEAGFSPSQLSSVESGAEFPLRQLGIFAAMDAVDLAVMRGLVARRTYTRGEIVFREGDESNELYVVAHGSASARLRLPGENRDTRLSAFSVGTVFGELALLDRAARSATVFADDDLVCYVLTHEHFELLTLQHPAIAIKLLSNLAREMSRTVRRSTRTIYQLAI
jgi:MFS superfamily sulfate permease-like transporter